VNLKSLAIRLENGGQLLVGLAPDCVAVLVVSSGSSVSCVLEIPATVGAESAVCHVALLWVDLDFAAILVLDEVEEGALSCNFEALVCRNLLEVAAPVLLLGDSARQQVGDVQTELFGLLKDVALVRIQHPQLVVDLDVED